VGTAGPQLQAPDLSGHCRTSAAAAVEVRQYPLRSGARGWKEGNKEPKSWKPGKDGENIEAFPFRGY